MKDSLQLFDTRPLPPGKILRQMMEEKGWSPEELATITGKHPHTIYALISGKTAVSLEMAIALGAAFGNPPEEWLKWDNMHRLSVAEIDAEGVRKRAKIYQIAPVRDMQKRGWIPQTKNPEELEIALKKFFASESLDEYPGFAIAPRKASPIGSLNPAEKAWCFRARQLAGTVPVNRFSRNRLALTERKLRHLAAFHKQVHQVPKVLSECGIRFVVIEPIAGAKIDGAAFWIEDQPVIAMSLRHDRIDGFWFTLMHEFAHVCAGDASVDTDLIDGTKGISFTLVEDEAERLANERASTSLIPADELQSFIRRVGPFYAKDRIIQFANKMKIHPGIIVGQLQHRQEIGYTALRELLVKVREAIVSTALTDGWNQTVAPSAF